MLSRMTFPRLSWPVALLVTLAGPAAAAAAVSGEHAMPTTSLNLGDANGDGVINSVDALVIAQTESGKVVKPFFAVAADTNCDGKIDSVDANRVAQFSVGNLTELKCARLGDANGDGVIDIVDALAIAQSATGQNPSPFNRKMADVDCDGTVTQADAMKVANFAAGTVSELFCPALGDANGDKVVDIKDALVTAQTAGGAHPQPFSADAADVNCDGAITIVDANIMAKFSAGELKELRCSSIVASIEVQPGSDGSNYFAIVTVRNRGNTPTSGWTVAINLGQGWQTSMWYASSFSSGNWSVAQALSDNAYLAPGEETYYVYQAKKGGENWQPKLFSAN